MHVLIGLFFELRKKLKLSNADFKHYDIDCLVLLLDELSVSLLTLQVKIMLYQKNVVVETVLFKLQNEWISNFLM